jgi:hypothetical protein
MPPFGIPELLLDDGEPGVGSEGVEEPAAPALPPERLLCDPALPPELLLCEPPALLELEDEDPLLDEELPAEPEDPEEEDEEGEDGDGIDEGICDCCSQPPMRNAPVAPAAASCSASTHARLSAARLDEWLTIGSPARESTRSLRAAAPLTMLLQS